MTDKKTGYVVWYCEHLRDGNEEGARCFHSIEEAMAFINADRFAKDNYSYELYELGHRIRIEQETVKEQEKVVVKAHKVWKLWKAGDER